MPDKVEDLIPPPYSHDYFTDTSVYPGTDKPRRRGSDLRKSAFPISNINTRKMRNDIKVLKWLNNADRSVILGLCCFSYVYIARSLINRVSTKLCLNYNSNF